MTYRTGSRGTTQGDGARLGARREGGVAGHAAGGAAQRGVRAGLGADARGVGASESRGGRDDTAGRAEACASGVGAAIVVVSPGELRAIVGAAVREAVEAMRDARAEGEAREAGAELREVVGAAVREAVEGLRHAEPAVWLDTAGAASVLAVHPRTVMKFVAAGRLAASRVGKLWRFRREDVERLLAGRGGSRDAYVELDGGSAMRGDLREGCVEGGGRDDVREAGNELDGASAMRGDVREACVEGDVGRDAVWEARGVLREAHGAVGGGLSGSREVCVERGGSREARSAVGGGLSGPREACGETDVGRDEVREARGDVREPGGAFDGWRGEVRGAGEVGGGREGAGGTGELDEGGYSSADRNDHGKAEVRESSGCADDAAAAR